CLLTSDGVEHLSEARLRGRLVFPARGDGPGFEPIFVPENESRTLAEMAPEARLFAHPRAAAVRALAPWLDESAACHFRP
ncbi:MAG: non-canonical purine NTP pyrophosphatase, partial [Polyangiaceae bacterium]|nr:non-canonical purine NTP pyrophosphatase [Polyangiaceae bacterium]